MAEYALGQLGFVGGAVKEYVVKEVVALAEVGDRIMLLNDRLDWLQTFVRDADQKRRSKENPFVALWVRQSRDVAFEVEDVLDDYYRKAFLPEEAFLGEKERPLWNTFFKCITHPFTKLCVLDDVAKRMNKIEKRLIDISKNKDDYKIESLGEPSSVWISSLSTNLAAWENSEEDMIGFDGYEETLKKLLMGPCTDSLAIITIIGESGSGKTKLARKIFNCEEVKKHFLIRSWTLLPPNYRVTKILRTIHKKVRYQVPYENKAQRYATKDDIYEMVKVELNVDRYLLVLDGITSITEWNSIKLALPDSRNGSRVVLIMQPDCKGIDNFVVQSLYALRIEHLDKEMSKRLFITRVFGMHKHHWSWFDENTYGNDVFTLTQGFPLAIVILAGLLRSKESQAQWDSEFKQLKEEMRVTALRRILAMSFDDLPYSLKSCFLYLGAFPEDKLHDGDKLVRLWISEGFIKPKKGKTLEEIGQQHLKELVSRCLVELVGKDAQGDVQLIYVNSLVHAFVQSEAQEAKFFEIHDNFDVIAPSTVRRLSIQNHIDMYVPLENSFPKLRSLICNFVEEIQSTKVHKSRTSWFLHASKFLRVIDLQGLSLESLPNAVGSMIHLRYLGVKNCGLLKHLPTTIGNLIYLQTFDVQDIYAGNMDEKFWNIPTLRHIFALKLKPPKTLKTKDILQLQTLHGIDCSTSDTAFIEKAMNLRSLELEGLSNLHMEALIVALRKLEFLVHLRLKCSKEASIPSDIFNISTLNHLQSLEIDGKLEKVQEENSMHSNSSTLPNLTKLILRNSEMCQEFIFMIAKFPRLSFLKFEYSSYSDKTLIFPENGFQGLTELHLSLDKLEEWTIEKLVMPELAKLYFWQCKSMKTVPDGIKDLHNLKEVMVYHSHMIAERIKDNGDDYYKVEHVPIIRVRWK